MDKLSLKLVTSILLILIFFSYFYCYSSENVGIITGIVLDSARNVPLRFATVRVAGQPKGSMTNADGRYIIKLSQGAYSLSYSMVGFRTVSREAAINKGDTLRIDINLAEMPFSTSEVVVTAEDPAVRLMRFAIEKKIRQRDSLRTYSYMLYTKFTAGTDTATSKRVDSRADTTIFSILETYSKGYYQRPDQYFNQIIQRRQTANFPAQANFLAIGTNLNIYDDEVSIFGELISSPFHPNALDFYSFTIEGETVNEGRTIVRLHVTPKTAQRKLFTGVILLDKDRFTPISVDLRPNKTVRLPFDATLRYTQHFEEISNKFVLPAGLGIEANLKAAIMFIAEPRLDFSIETVAYDYVCNTSLDDELFEQRRVEVSPIADIYDSTFWTEKSVLPLRPEEIAAYSAIQTLHDNPDSLEASGMFDNPINDLSREITKLMKRPFTGSEDIYRYNRIQGNYFGLGLIYDIDTALEIRGGGGYGVSDKHWQGWCGATAYFNKLRQYSLNVAVYRHLTRCDANSSIGTNTNTLLSLLFKNDYGDYYYANGFEISAEANYGQLKFVRQDLFVRPTSVKLFFRNETQSPAFVSTQYSLFGGGNFRDNPLAMAGILRSFGCTINLNFSPLRRIFGNGLRIETEVSEPTIIPTDFSFKQVQATLYMRTRTLPLWMLNAKLMAGWSKGNVPPQRFFSLESSASGTAAEGAMRGLGVKEFYGDRYAALTFEHDFGEIIPGLFRIPNIASFGLEFLLTGAAAYTTFSEDTRNYTGTSLMSTSTTNDKFYYEIGLGINRIFLFFRTDITARLSQRNSPHFFFTLSAATF